MTLPAPLVPANVDLRDFAFMPLDVLRLRDSVLSADSTGDEFKAAVILWCASWHQVPAGSLPNNESSIARLAGHVATSKKWKSIRDGALRGWFQCDDNRFYHPVVSEKANEAWTHKVRQRERTEAARNARNAIKSTNAPSVTDNVTTPVTDNVTTSVVSNTTHTVTGSKGPDRTGPDLKKEDNDPLPLSTIQKEGGGDLGFEEFWELFPKDEFASRPKAQQAFADLTPGERLQAIAAIPALKASKPTTHKLSPERYLSERRFATTRASRPATGPPKVEVKRESPQGNAWDAYLRKTRGKGAVWNNGFWYFDTEWPPTEEVA